MWEGLLPITALESKKEKKKVVQKIQNPNDSIFSLRE